MEWVHVRLCLFPYGQGARVCFKPGKTPSWGVFSRQDCVDLT